jgi:enamine deaminase RidA (YjgF/YER057c/UK114 family)
MKPFVLVLLLLFPFILFAQDYEQRLKDLGIELPEPGAPVATYVKGVVSGNMVYLAGHGPSKPEGGYITGKIGQDLTQEEGYAAARLAGLAMLSTLKNTIGDLNRVARIVKVTGMVNCVTGYGNQPEVINGFSDLMVEVFGENGKHARSAVGMDSLPRNICVEVEMIVELKN